MVDAYASLAMAAIMLNLITLFLSSLFSTTLAMVPYSSLKM
jgi:hypothetical protein